MASLYTTRSRNVTKTFFLMSVFAVIVIGIGWLVSWYFESSLILWGVVIFVVGTNVYAYWNSDKTAIRLTHAHPITREEHFNFWNAAENISISIGAPMPKLYIIEDPSPNAFAVGRSPEHSAVIATTGLLNMLNKEELEGVVAHEIAHIQNRDTLLMTVTVVLFGVATIVLDFILHSFFWGDSRDKGAFAIIGLVIIALLTPTLLTLLRLAISRKREFVADASAAIYTRYPDGLASALEKISKHAQPMEHANTATAHLFISDPFAEEKEKELHPKDDSFSHKFHRMFSTHPPVNERIAALRQ